jgi:hypothetical protein
MKTLANRIVMFAASAAALATMAYGQPRAKAEIPFAFHTANATLPAGSYLVSRVSRGIVGELLLENTVSHRSAIVLGTEFDARTTASQPGIVFACVNGNCSLSAIRMGNGTLNFPARNKALVEQETASIVAIPLTRRSGE